jgi:hypothetical protein
MQHEPAFIQPIANSTELSGQPKAPEKSGEAEQGGEEATKVEGGAATTKAAETGKNPP